MGARESVAGEMAVGYLTSESVLRDGATYGEAVGDLHADAEAVVEFGRDVDPSGGVDSVRNAIVGYGAALELVDLAPVPGEPEAVVATNVFHRAVAFKELRAVPSGDVRVLVNDETRAASAWPGALHERLARAALLLEAVGERFVLGDRVITGSIVQVPISVGDAVTADFGGLTEVRLRVASA
jgi:2-keto-4-pentenoate hydratase